MGKICAKIAAIKVISLNIHSFNPNDGVRPTIQLDGHQTQ